MKKDFLIKDKIKRLVDSGVDLSGYHEIEFQFYVMRESSLQDMRVQFYHPDNSMRVHVIKLRGSIGYSFRLRIDSQISERRIGEELLWLSNVADEHDVLLEGWRVVAKAK